MKIRLAIIEKDENYLKRLVSSFNVKYSDRFEIYSFTSSQMAFDNLSLQKIDVMLLGEDIDIGDVMLPDSLGLGYLVSTPGLESYNDKPAVCKFQRIDNICKSILGLYAEQSDKVAGFSGSVDSKLVLFTSPAGGVGTSSAAAACAINFSKKGKKTIYLCDEVFGSSDAFFTGEGDANFSDVVFALKSHKSNLPLKLESCVKQDTSGAYFYSESSNALDMMELTNEELSQMISNIQLAGGYDYIILDIPFGLDKASLNLMKLADEVVLVSDGSSIANCKIIRALDAMRILEENGDQKILQKCSLIYNRFKSEGAAVLQNTDITNLGGINRIEGTATPRNIIDATAQNPVFEKLL